MNPMWSELSERVCWTAKRMASLGLVVGTGGNVSARIPGETLAAITPARIPYERLVPEDIVVVALDGTVVEGRHPASSETPMHTLVYKRLPAAGASLIADGDTILNHCWAESGIVYTLCAALQQGKRLTAYCSETRPYLQGARLTADAIADMGIPTTVVTDNMPTHLMSKGMISTFFAGADRVTMDGHVVNKIGTLQLAICTLHYGIPFYAFCYGPDRQAPTPASVVIEERDPEDVLHCLGRRTATLKARGYYPAFDVTPPELVSGLVTNRGVFAPGRVGEYFK